MKEKNILLIWDRIGDYHLARVKACEEVFKGAVYTADLAGTDSLYKWNSIEQAHHTVLSFKAAEQSDILPRFKAFRKIIKENNIHVVAAPYGRTEYLLFLLYARLTGLRTIVFCESWYTRGKVKDFFKSVLLKTIGNRYFVSGQRAYEHLTKRYGIQSSRVFKGYSVVDNAHFSIQNSEGNVPVKKYLICVARYSKEKNLATLIRSFAKSAIQEKYTLLLVGDGPERTSLQNVIDREGLKDRVVLSGWVTYNELPALYAASAAFVLPSTFEPWGLVVNEAMAAGLPVFISKECGCEPDLLDEGKNGWSFSANNEQELIQLLNKFAHTDIIELTKMSTHSIHIIDAYTPEAWAINMASILADLTTVIEYY